MPDGVRMITGVGTSTAAFIAPIDGGSAEPRRVRSWQEFTELYALGNKDRELAGPNLVEAVNGFFANGGTTCYVVGTDGDDLGAYTAGLAGLKEVPEVNMVAVPDLWKSESDAPAIARAIAAHCVQAGNRLALLHTKQGASPEDAAKTPGLFGLDEGEAQFTTVYYPWINVAGVSGTARTVPPSGHIAGVWARTDAERGVFKAPANQKLKGALSIDKELTDDEQRPLNEAGVNCLRVFPDRGLLVWGARTLSTSRDWQQLNVRRLVSFLADSTRTGTAWAATEPNDDRLQATLRHSVSTFLTDQWRQGALMGQTPDNAFSVICDETNNSIDNGKVIIEIGIAPVRPAEFVHFTITQIAGQPGHSA